MFKTTHTATKAETYLKVMLDYKINSQQRALLRQVTSEILSADGNAYDVTIAFMIGQLNAFSEDYDDPSHAFKIAQYVAEKNIVLSEMNFEATIDWHDEIRSLTQKYVAPQTEEYLSQEETAATPEGEEEPLLLEPEEEPLLLETPTESHGGVEGLAVSVELREVPDEYLEAAYNEMQNDRKHVATWARAFSKSEGDVSRAEAIYIKDRSEKLFEKAKAKRLADEAEAKRLADEAKAKRLADEAEAKRLADEAKAKRLEREWEEEERQYETRRLEKEKQIADEKLRFRWGLYWVVFLGGLLLLAIRSGS